MPTAVDRSGVLAGKTVKHLVTGYNHNCVIASDDKLYCWGSNLYGELGNGTMAETATPVFATVSTTGVLANKAIAQVVLGRGFTCVLTTEGRAYCWGRNSIGSLGNGTKVDSLQAVPVAMNGALAGKTITQLTAGDLYVCALASDKKVYCWGANGDGQLGHGDAGRQVSDPVPVSMAHISPAKQFHSISAGGDHTCGITSDKSLYCWGNNSNGQLGNGTTTNANAPVEASLAGVPHGDTITQVSAGGRHTCVMTEQGRVLCVGNNDNGQLGNGTTTNSSTLTPITPVTHQHIHATIPASTTKLVAQYAKKTPAATCHSIAASQWQDITTTSALAYASTGPAQGAPLAPYGDDPTPPAGSTAYNLQGVVRGITASPHVFSNSDPISVEQTGLWDFALTNKALAPNTHYCLRLTVDTAAAPGMRIDTYSAYPEIVTASGTLDIRFTNAAGTTLTNPTTTFSPATTGSTATTTATLSNASSQQLEVANSASPTGWNVSLAPTGGASAAWTQTGGAARYSYNSTVSSQGRLSIDLSAGTFVALGTTATGQACTTAGLSYSPGGSYIAGTATASAITIASAASSSGLNCTFRLQNIQLRQTIPAYQTPGTYTLPITATVTAQ